MLESDPAPNFFLSVYSPQGYVERFRELYSAESGWKTYIITGSLSPDAARLTSAAGRALEASGEKVNYIGSCCEPGRVSAAVCEKRRLCIVDASVLSSMNLSLPGLCDEIFDVGDTVEQDTLDSHRRSILAFAAKYRTSAARAYRFLTAAAGMDGDTLRLALECADMAKLERYAGNLSRRLFPPLGSQGKESVMYLSAVTADGVVGRLPEENISLLYALDDEYGLGKLFLNKIRCAALSSGYDVVSCPCPLFPEGKPEHLFIPSLNLAFVTTRRSHPFSCTEGRQIHIRRFLDAEAIRQRRPRISFERRASRELVSEAVMLLDDARANRRMIESIYAEATDADRLKDAEKRLIDHVLAAAAKTY
jgi:hypothetical protein